MGAGRQIIQGHLASSCCKRGAARDAEGRDHCVGGGQLRLHTEDSSELWIAASKGASSLPSQCTLGVHWSVCVEGACLPFP